MNHAIIFGMFLVFFQGFNNQAYCQNFRVSAFDIGSTYTQATKFTDDSVDHAENYGFGIETKFQIHKNLRFGVSFNYTPLKITEYNPWVAMTRNGDKKWQMYQKFINTYTGYKYANAQPMYDIKWYYTTYYYNFDVLLNLEYTPISEGLFQPYIAVGGGPVKYYTTAWWFTEWTAIVDGRKYHQSSRLFSEKKFRGWYWPVFVGAGFDLMFSEHFGFQVSGRYHAIAKNHFRNRTDAYYRLKAGLVFH